jgi:ketosteroid isomerase-like protein
MNATNPALDTNKELARGFLLAIVARDAAAMRSMLAPEAYCSLMVAGVYSPRLRAFPLGTRWDREGTIAMEMHFQRQLDGPFELRILSVIAEGNSVAAEVIGKGYRAATGRPYLQHYSYHFQMDNGRIADIRLYHDTFHHWQVWSELESAVQPPYLKGGKIAGFATDEAVPLLSDIATDNPVAVNKTSARRFLTAVQNRDWETIRATWSPEGRWSPAICGDYVPERRTFDGAPCWDREGLIELLQNAGRNHREPLTTDIYSLIAEGDQISLEAVGFTLRVNGRAYRQHYSLHFKAHNGRLVECHEYQDTLHQYDVTQDVSEGGPVLARTSPASP